MVLGYVNGKWAVQDKGFSPAGCYEWFKGNRPKVPWARLVWNEWVLPKHQFIRWLIVHGALRTNDKLVLYGMDVDDRCYLCSQATKRSDHLFFECAYSKKLIHSINQKLGCHIPETNVLDWCLHRTGTKMQLGVQAAVVWGAIYHIWQQRNKCKIDCAVTRPENLSEQIIEEVKARIRGRDFQHMTKAELDWLSLKNLYVMVD
ncbi:uncharacterized protein LOC141608339 [Silene latifolia]|uniref:uncharacterized protein LOC141608339 n=1 Tax=Silene latifolia TaxID=37657 RepID=UPI003D773AFF